MREPEAWWRKACSRCGGSDPGCWLCSKWVEPGIYDVGVGTDPGPIGPPGDDSEGEPVHTEAE